MNMYLRKGNLKFTPEETGEPFYIYDLGTYHVAVEKDSLGHEILSLFSKRFLDFESISNSLPHDPEVVRRALYKLEGAGILASATGRTEKSALYSLLKNASFGPGIPAEGEIYSFVNTFWKKDGLYQDSYLNLSDIAKAVSLPGERLREEMFTLIQKESIVCYDRSPKYPKERYSSVSNMPFIVYTEKGNSIDMAKLFIKEVPNVS